MIIVQRLSGKAVTPACLIERNEFLAGNDRIMSKCLLDDLRQNLSETVLHIAFKKLSQKLFGQIHRNADSTAMMEGLRKKYSQAGNNFGRRYYWSAWIPLESEVSSLYFPASFPLFGIECLNFLPRFPGISADFLPPNCPYLS